MPADRVFHGFAAAILAGGLNKRMGGKNKAFLRIGGSSILGRAMRILKESFEEILLIANSPDDYAFYGRDARIVTDIIKNKGPLGGIHAGLSQTSREAVFFVACDMPFLHNALIRSQLSCFSKLNCDCLVPRIGPLVEPLHAIYKKSLKDKISGFLKSGGDYSIKGFLDKVNVFYWDLEDNRANKKVFKNLNTREDFLNADKI